MTMPSRIFIAILLFVSACAPVPRTEFAPPYGRTGALTIFSSGADSVVKRVVTDGVIHRQIVRKVGPWNIHVLTIDLKKRNLDILSARAFDSLKGRETTSSIARRASRDNREVLGAMNADFFNMQTGENDLNQIIEGEIVKGVKKPLRAQFALGYSRTPYIEKFVFEGTAITSDARFGIDAVNSLKDSTMVVLNRFFGIYARKENESVLVLHTARRNGDTIVTVVWDSLKTGEQFSVRDSMQLLRAHAFNQTQVKRIAIGDTVRLVLGFLPRKEHLKTLVGGLPRIVADGRNLPATDSLPGLTAKFTETRHPRTGIGFSGNGTILYFVTVDGRQQSSVGMSLKEFAALMIEIGCYQALNLDGGGSTAMVVEDKVVNSPSDSTGERPVANALLVVKDRK